MVQFHYVMPLPYVTEQLCRLTSAVQHIIVAVVIVLVTTLAVIALLYKSNEKDIYEPVEKCVIKVEEVSQ